VGCRAEERDDFATRFHSHGRAFARKPRRLHRRGLDVDAHAKTEQAAFGARRCLLTAKRVEVEDLERLFERLQRRGLDERVAAW
jgi:hypothetical protein